MAYEALNNAAQMKTNFIIILNDNEMSISENVGGLSTYLSNLRTADAYTGLKAGLEKSPESNSRVRQPDGGENPDDQKRNQTADYSRYVF